MKMYVLATLFFASVQGFGQKGSDDEISFEYRRLPLSRWKKHTPTTKSKVELMYAGENSAGLETQYQKNLDKYHEDVKLRSQRIAEAEEQYKVVMKKWEAKDKIIEDQYQKELAEWNKKLAVQKLMEGFKNVPNNAVIVTCLVGAFDCISPDLKTVTKAMTCNANGKSEPYNQNYYHWETSYKQPINWTRQM
jgi:hypothetical protein